MASLNLASPSTTISFTTRSTGSVIGSRHPDYSKSVRDWEKWRLAYEGGENFIQTYMRKMSSREDDQEFRDRKDVAYCPAFGAAAINDIKNAIFQRTADVVRTGGSDSYAKAVLGLNDGVDLNGSAMSTFIGQDVLPELLVMRKVGVLVDNPQDLGTTQQDKSGKHPYFGTYHAEDILSWAPKRPTEGFDIVLLREWVDVFDSVGLPNGCEERYRLMKKTNKGIEVTFYDKEGKQTATTILALDQIPFVVFEITQSLMKNTADYQIALLNLESADISFAQKANFPFYYEYFDPKTEMAHMKPPAEPGNTGTKAENKARDREVKAGSTDGRRFPSGLKEPGFINPDPETLRVSMEKERQIKEDIRLLVNLNLTNMNPRRQSAESKEMDQGGLEASLSYIGLVLETGERKLAGYWEAFEGSRKVAQITYPKTYNIKSEDERQEEADRLEKMSDKIPSETFRREVKKKTASLLIGGEVTDETLTKIKSEINESDVLTSDPNVILSAHKAGLVDDITASNAIGFDGKSVVDQAKKDRAERIKLTMEAQGGPENADGNRGAPEFDKGQPVDEKVGKPQRGAQDNTDKGSEQK